MQFTQRKLPPEAVYTLRVSPIDSVEPFALTLAPMYVFLKRNEKFVSVKAPLDFFVPEELDKLRPLGNFFIPDFVDKVVPFRRVARSVAALLKWEPPPPAKDGAYPPVALPISAYELSDAVLRAVGPLWGAGGVIEPFFAAVFGNELCDLLPPDSLLKARDENVERFELGVLRSGWAVFLALHLGHCDLEFLNGLRLRVFEEAAGLRDPVQAPVTEADALVEVAAASLESPKQQKLEAAWFEGRPERAAQKIRFRLKRVTGQLIVTEQPAPTIFGPEGFIDG